MNLTISRKSLLEALQSVIGVVPARTPKPIIQNVKLTVDGEDTVTLTATDTEVGICTTFYMATESTAASVLLPAQRVLAILRASQGEYVTIKVDGDKLTIKGERSRYDLTTEDADLYPDVPGFEATSYVTVTAHHLRDMIRRTIFATDVTSSL